MRKITRSAHARKPESEKIQIEIPRRLYEACAGFALMEHTTADAWIAERLADDIEATADNLRLD